MQANEQAIKDIVDMYFGESEKSLEELFEEYLTDLDEEESERVIECIRQIVS